MKLNIKKTCLELFALSLLVSPVFAGPRENKNPGDPPAVSAEPRPHPNNKPFPYPHRRPHPEMNDLDIFLSNADEKPIKAARALMRLLGKMDDPQKAEEFLVRHTLEVVAIISGIEHLKEAGQLDEDKYRRIFNFFSQYGISSVSPGNSRSSGGRRHPIISALEVRRTIDSGNEEEAEKKLEKLKRDYRDNPFVVSAAAEYYNELGKFDKAEETATSAIEMDSSNTSAYKTRARARISVQNRKGAINDIKKVLELDPQDESAKILAILIESRKETPDLKTLSSLNEMKKALGNLADISDIQDPRLKSGEEMGGLNAGPPAGGAVAAGAVDSDSFNKSKSFLRTAVSKNKLGDFPSAAKYATLAIKNDPNNVNAYLERAISNNFLGNYASAVKDASFVLERDPSNISALNIRSWALNKMGNYKSANEDASKALEINPNFADAWFNRAIAMENMGDWKGMLENYQKAATLSNSYKRYYQDAVAQYSYKVPDYEYEPSLFKGDIMPPAPRKKPLKNFLILMAFTITGGLLIGLGFMHIASGRLATQSAATSGAATTTHPGEISPSVFYEGITSGKYKILRKIGEGGMGIVYEAVDQSLERKVAMKKMIDEIKINETEKQRFLQEARMVAFLHHPNIIEIYTIFEDNGDIYLVFEHVDGTTLDKVLDRDIRLPFDKASDLFLQVADALVYAHSKNIVHRDLKLSNIMISSENQVKIMDFGLARKSMEIRAKSTHTEVVGSPAYMAPEQDLGEGGKSCDIFALGVCFYETLSGTLPFHGPDFHYQKERKMYAPLTETVPGLPGQIDEFVAKSLEPKVENRFQYVEEWKKALDRLA